MTVRGVVFSALFAALLAVFSFVRIDLGFTPVPITLETLAVMLAGVFLGARYGFFSMLLVVVLTAVGLPLLAGHGGLSVIFGPTGGYVVVWPINALLLGWFTQKVKGNGLASYIVAFIVVELFGSVLTYVVGVPWLAAVKHLSFAKAMLFGCYPYLLGDALKAAVTVIIFMPLRNVYPPSRLVGKGPSDVVLEQPQSPA